MVWRGRIVGTACVLLVVSFVSSGPVQAAPGRPSLATAGGRTRVVRQVSHAVYRPGIDDLFRTDIIYGGKDSNDASTASYHSAGDAEQQASSWVNISKSTD